MTRKQPELLWAYDLASMIQVSLVGYAVAGLFLGLAYFDLYYHLLAVLVITERIMLSELERVRGGETVPGPTHGRLGSATAFGDVVSKPRTAAG
jgi:hypothetical protein